MAPPSKRRRTFTEAEDDTPDKHEVFVQWSQDRGVEIGSVKPATLPGRGVGLVTTSNVKKDERLLFVPEKAMFRPNLNLFGREKSKWFQQKASPQAQLALSMIYECQRDDSPYHIWKATWPTQRDFEVSMPLFWSERLRSHLPPAVQQPLTRQIDDFERDLAFSEEHTPEERQEVKDKLTFQYHWAIVNSRSFHFKPPGSRPGYMVLCPFIDYMNHAASGSTVNVKQTPKGYEVTADRDYEPDEEILATYGAHSNDRLLVHYGFVNDTVPGESSDDDIRLDDVILPGLSDATRQQLQDVGYLGGYALLPSTNEICFKTQVSIRAELLTANEWEYFISTGEDMGPDQNGLVFAWLIPRLVDYRATAEKMIRDLKPEGRKPGTVEADAEALIQKRWTQIRDALDAFLEANKQLCQLIKQREIR